MKWGRQIDYHGSRSYETGEPAVTQLSLMIAWFIGMMKSLRKFVSRPPSSTVLLRDGQRNFSILGGSSSGERLERPVECPLPTTSRTAPNGIVSSRLRNEN